MRAPLGPSGRSLAVRPTLPRLASIDQSTESPTTFPSQTLQKSVHCIIPHPLRTICLFTPPHDSRLVRQLPALPRLKAFALADRFVSYRPCSFQTCASSTSKTVAPILYHLLLPELLSPPPALIAPGQALPRSQNTLPFSLFLSYALRTRSSPAAPRSCWFSALLPPLGLPVNLLMTPPSTARRRTPPAFHLNSVHSARPARCSLLARSLTFCSLARPIAPRAALLVQLFNSVMHSLLQAARQNG